MENNNNITNPGATLDVISGCVCGNQEIQVDDFESLKCPICGQCMQISGIDYDGETNYERRVMHQQDYVDDYGLSHCRVFGRDKREEQSGLHMRCPNNCVREMILDIKHITLGPYREFTERRR